ncbi:hypothetical protein [Virgibacillus necropolis]|uniref:hypothetical protein n=1 Tax=Virgibacillus necropolis TaxID=163877 RepID=UPI001D051CC7|nr:hypothetical protein [Virgibacillus necropolis]
MLYLSQSKLHQNLNLGGEVHSVLSEKARIDATNTIKDTFHDIKQKGFGNRSYILEKKGSQMTCIVERLLDDIMKRKDALSLLADR